MEWSGQMDYVKANWKEFEVDGKEAGLTTGYGPLQFLKVCISAFVMTSKPIKENHASP